LNLTNLRQHTAFGCNIFRVRFQECEINPWMVVPHGSYLLNCGSSDEEVLRKTRETLIDELKRCKKLGLPIYNFHPGFQDLAISLLLALHPWTCSVKIPPYGPTFQIFYQKLKI